MTSDSGQSLGREAPFPLEMQGRWVEDEDRTWEVIVSGSEISWGGIDGDYQNKTFTVYEDGTIAVTLELEGEAEPEDYIQLAFLPDGSMFAHNVHFVARLVRPNA